MIDSKGEVLPKAGLSVTFKVTGDASIVRVTGDKPNIQQIALNKLTDSTSTVKITGGCRVIFRAGRTLGHIKFEAKADSLFPGATEIHTVQPGIAHAVTDEKYVPQKVKGKILGADISFLPELESRGTKFSDNGKPGDAIQIMKDHGFNYIRLRIFNAPANPKGYSPDKGFCDLEHTKQMAKRIKAAGMKFLLDFHYSDTWADPGKQYMPDVWKDLSFQQLAQKVHEYTKHVLLAFKAQGTLPDMVQTGNEINHGILWPDGNVQHLDSLAILLNAGLSEVKQVNPSIITLIHIALGGQNSESEFFLDNMISRGVSFDAIGQSYYPKWHGTLNDLDTNLRLLQKKYNKPVIVAEYSQLKEQVNRIAFSLPGNQMKGTFIWEPLSTWESVFDKDGKANKYLYEYDEITKEFIKDQH